MSLQEQQLIRIFAYFSLLTMIVACLGLFGLSSLATTQRTKEVGVRNVMGAQMPGLIYLLSRQCLVLIGLAMSRWLQDFAYHVSLGPGEFVLAGGVAFGIAALTTGYQTIRLAGSNPVQALRYE